MRVHLHALLFIEYPFNISTFFIEMQLLVEIWEFRGGKFSLARASRKIRVLIEEPEQQFSGRMPATEKARFDESRGVRRQRRRARFKRLLCEAVYSPAGRGRRISALTVSIVGRMVASDWYAAAYGACFNPVTQTIAVDHSAVTWCD
ncbi:hypothetical protein LB553_03115 [Mesorhizobium sp. CA8]|uniref:hypothetical protein n=1 Tax=Mesorhizobium sp. CA8 TaxID=2876637 RepID=UPI001CC9E233|nr:hypothetical protein [Mesorhizobium sp. CA8]MBZ9759872.1 hypothetical protein [Mesorhizobium sp. CA8]